MARVIAIGDIHGCNAALTAIVDALQLAEDDVVVTLGDYIDRGPDSAGVVDQLIELQARCQLRPLLGNHEAMLLMAVNEPSELAFWVSCGGREALESYGGGLESIPESHMEFFRSCQLYFETDDHFFVHANYSPQIPLSKQQEYVLLWEHLTSHMPGRHKSGKKAVMGHTPQRDGEVLTKDHLVCIDTYCYGGGWLTALDITAQTVWQADIEGQLRGH